MILAVIEGRRIQAIVSARLAARWRSLGALMTFFVIGYMAAFAASVLASERLLLAFTGVVFVAGAYFVLLVVRLGLQTITDLNASIEREHRQAAQLAGTLDELTVANRRLASSNRELEQFAYVASHDLQEPLRKVTAFSDMLKDSEAARLSPEGVDLLDRMQRAATRMSRLINDLLSFSRVSRADEPVQDVDLGKVVGEVLEDLEARRADAEVVVGSLPTVRGRPTQLRQLFQNLIGNALKFRRDGVRHEVRVTSSGGALLVADNGIGFEPQYAERIFGIFQRLHGRSQYEGTGIGLAICQRVASNHGWELVAEGKPGAGATFTITMGEETER